MTARPTRPLDRRPATTLQMLVDAINAVGAGRRALRLHRQPVHRRRHATAASRGGNIRTAFLYRTDRVDLVDGSLRDDRRRTARRSPIRPAMPTSRPTRTIRSSTRARRWSRPSRSTARTSRSSTTTSPRRAAAARCYGSDQPPLNAGEVQRAAQAQAVNNFVDGLLAQRSGRPGRRRRRSQRVPSSRSRWRCSRARPRITNYDVPGTTVRRHGDLHAGRHRGAARSAGHCCRRTSATTTSSKAMPQTLDHVLVTERPAAQARSSTSCASMRNSPTRPATTIRWWRASSIADQPCTPYRLQLLHAVGRRGRALTRSTAPATSRRSSTAFDDDYANTIILSVAATTSCRARSSAPAAMRR